MSATFLHAMRVRATDTRPQPRETGGPHRTSYGFAQITERPSHFRVVHWMHVLNQSVHPIHIKVRASGSQGAYYTQSLRPSEKYMYTQPCTLEVACSEGSAVLIILSSP